mmetsp:Transcript_31681/g.71651  ORF Transcript_31681/g.71651 Transcript_31681/m.71651 type:complete len:98 (-) Transcript_31681:790-1083(-)
MCVNNGVASLYEFVVNLASYGGVRADAIYVATGTNPTTSKQGRGCVRCCDNDMGSLNSTTNSNLVRELHRVYVRTEPFFKEFSTEFIRALLRAVDDY